MDDFLSRFDAPLALLARLLLAALFFMAGVDAMAHVEGFTTRLVADGLPAWIYAAVVWFLILSALALILGFKTTWVALAMAGFSLVSGLLDYADFEQSTDMVMLLKNIALTGGYLFAALHGPGRWSVDAAVNSHKIRHAA